MKIYEFKFMILHVCVSKFTQEKKKGKKDKDKSVVVM